MTDPLIADIIGWPGYRVTSEGTVWSCRTYRGRLGDDWRQLRPYADRAGYLSVALQNGGVRRTRNVAHLVLEAFTGPRPAGAEACHWPDTNPANNAVANLRWGTSMENAADKIRGGTVASGERNGRSKLTDSQVIEIRNRYQPGARNGRPAGNARELAAEFGVGAGQIGRLVKAGVTA